LIPVSKMVLMQQLMFMKMIIDETNAGFLVFDSDVFSQKF
jgi:hypothetical protein